VATIELQGPTARDAITLERDRWSFGTSAAADYAISDTAVSRIHCMFERIGRGWFIEDLGSSNGTFINGELLFGTKRRLRDGDEIRIGHTHLRFRDRTTPTEVTTDVLERPPAVTARERDVLIELCRPILNGNTFTQPASVGDIAAALFVGTAAVKQHLSRLYDKFGIDERGIGRRAALANAAVSRGAVTIADIAGPEGG
jgi:hypothetical protein